VAADSVTAPSEARLRAFSREELTLEFRWFLDHGEQMPQWLRREFLRRFWDRCEESAAHGFVCQIPPTF